MSVWTELDGTVTVHKDAHFSLDKHIKEYFETESTLDFGKPKIHVEHVGQWQINHLVMSICEDGLDAACVVEELFYTLPKGSTMDIDAHIRFIK